MSDIMNNPKERIQLDLAVSDILSKRFAKIIKDKRIDIEEFAKSLGTDWYVPCFNRISFKDGTFDPVPRNMLIDV